MSILTIILETITFQLLNSQRTDDYTLYFEPPLSWFL